MTWSLVKRNTFVLLVIYAGFIDAFMMHVGNRDTKVIIQESGEVAYIKIRIAWNNPANNLIIFRYPDPVQPAANVIANFASINENLRSQY